MISQRLLAYLHREWLKRVVHNTAFGSGTLKQYVIVSTTAFVTSRPRAISFYISVSRIVSIVRHTYLWKCPGFFFLNALCTQQALFSITVYTNFFTVEQDSRKSKQRVNYRIRLSLSAFTSAKLYIFVKFLIYIFINIQKYIKINFKAQISFLSYSTY